LAQQRDGISRWIYVVVETAMLVVYENEHGVRPVRVLLGIEQRAHDAMKA
jgi:hypothetical protein